MIEKLYTVEEVAELASVTGRTIRNYLKSGRLKGRKIGGQWRFPESEVQRLLTGVDDDAYEDFLEEPQNPDVSFEKQDNTAYFEEEDTNIYEDMDIPNNVTTEEPSPADFFPFEDEAVPEFVAPVRSAATQQSICRGCKQDMSQQQPVPTPQPAVPVQQQPAPVPQQHAVPPASTGFAGGPSPMPPAYSAPSSSPLFEPAAQQSFAFPPPNYDNGGMPAYAPMQPSMQYPAFTPGNAPLSGGQHTYMPQNNPPANPMPSQEYPAYNFGYEAAAMPQNQPAQPPAAPPAPAYNRYANMPQQQAYTPAAPQPAYMPYATAPEAPPVIQPPLQQAAPQPQPLAEPEIPPVAPLGAAAPPPAPVKPPQEPEVQPPPPATDFPELSDVGMRVAQFAAEVHDCSEGPQTCAIIDLYQSFALAKETSDRIAEIAQQENEEGSIPCQSFVEFDARYFIARYTLFGSSMFLSRCLTLIG